MTNGSRVASLAAGDMVLALAIRAALSLTASIGLVVAAVFAFRHGRTTSEFAGYLSPEPITVVRLSGPWVVGAGALLLVAGLLFTAAVADLFRRRRLRRSRREFLV